MKVAWHLGLGDAIICAPIIVWLAGQYDEITVPCYAHNFISVQSFFALHDNIKVEVIADDTKLYNYDIRLGQYNKELPLLPTESFDQWFYRQAGLDMQERDKHCPLQKAVENVEQLTGVIVDYIFKHDDHERGFVIDYNKMPDNDDVVLPMDTPGTSILRYAETIQWATEIHCIDSSFIHLCDALQTTGKLFWHQYARRYESPLHDIKFRKNWTILK